MHWLKHIEVVLFDLDGTLYQEENFYSRYLELLLERTDHRSRQQSIAEELSLILKGSHACKIGDWYNTNSDLWIRFADEELSVFSWEGLSHEGHSFDSESRSGLIYAGDVWSLVAIMASRYQIDEASRKEAFFQVRKEMLEQLGRRADRQALAESICGLTHIRSKILLTNSPEETGREFVDALGFSHVFDRIVYSAGKPVGLENFVTELMEQEGLQANQIVSIGDHAWNDLYPLRKLGGRTVWISPYNSSDRNQWDVHISSLDELSTLLQQLQQAKTAAAQL